MMEPDTSSPKTYVYLLLHTCLRKLRVDLVRQRAHGTRIDKLTSDYLNVTAATYLFSVE